MKKIDKNKVYAFIGRAVARLGVLAIANIATYNFAIYILDNCITVYR